MKSVYESAKNIINERLGASGAADANKNKPNLNLMDRFRTSVGIPVGGTKPQVAAAEPVEKPQTAMTPSVKKAAVNKPAQSTMAPGPSQDKLNAVQRSTEKSGPDLDSMKKNIVKVPTATAAAEAPKKYEMDKGPDDEGTQKTASSYSTNTGPAKTPGETAVANTNSSVLSALNKPAEPKPQAAVTPTPAADNTVKSGSGGTVTTSDGSPLKTRTDDEIAKQNKKGRGAAMESVNKKFSVSDALYQSVMEVMKGSKEGSTPRNEKEKDLAKFHGDPNRITHGDVLKARGVTKEEVENVEEMSSKMKMKLGLYGKKKKTNEESVEEGMMDTVKTSVKKVAKKAFKALTGGSDKEQLQALRKRMGMKEAKDTPGNSYEHQCAIHVKSESFGEGRTITTQHADPDADGNIAWYDVMFEHGIEKQVPTDTLEILVSESHMHSKKKKAM